MIDVLRQHEIECVVHFGALACVAESMHEPLKYYLNNVAATLQLLEAMHMASVKRFVFSSSCASFGEIASPPAGEDTPQNLVNTYGQTKLDIENALRILARTSGLSSAIFRYFNAAGAAEDGSIGEDHDPEAHLIPLAIGAATGNRPPLKVYGIDYPTPDGTCLRDYVHVDDLTRAHIAVLDRLREPGICADYNLGTGRPTSVREVINTVTAVVEQPVPWEPALRRPGENPRAVRDSAKAKRELGWKPRFQTIESIVASAWKWHCGHPGVFADTGL